MSNKMISVPLQLSERQSKDLLRFNETTEDGQGYDVPVDRMKALARIGLVRSIGFSRYEFTDAGVAAVSTLQARPAFAPHAEHKPAQALPSAVAIELAAVTLRILKEVRDIPNDLYIKARHLSENASSWSKPATSRVIGTAPLVGLYYPAECPKCGWLGSSEECSSEEVECPECCAYADEVDAPRLLEIIQGNPSIIAVPGTEPILVEAVAVTRQSDDEGLSLDWLLEGGISALEVPGTFLLVAHGTITNESGHGHVLPAVDCKHEQ